MLFYVAFHVKIVYIVKTILACILECINKLLNVSLARNPFLLLLTDWFTLSRKHTLAHAAKHFYNSVTFCFYCFYCTNTLIFFLCFHNELSHA